MTTRACYLGRGIIFALLLTIVSSAQTRSISDFEQSMWDVVKKKSDPGAFKAYLRRYPNGAYADEAHKKIKMFSGKRDSLVAVVSERLAETCGGNEECKAPPEPERIEGKGDIDRSGSSRHRQSAPDDSGTARSDGVQKSGSAFDLAFWNSIKDSDNPVLFKEYLKKFPDGVFVTIAREKLKRLRRDTDAASPRGGLGEQVSAARKRENETVITKEGVGGLSTQTPFTAEAIRRALPAYMIRKRVTHSEGMRETSYIAYKGEKRIMRIDGDAGKISNVTVFDRSVIGPNGVRAGDTLSEINGRIRLGDCMGGYDEMADRVVCSPLRDDDIFSFAFALKKPLPPLADDQPLRADMLPRDIRLSSIAWMAGGAAGVKSDESASDGFSVRRDRMVIRNRSMRATNASYRVPADRGGSVSRDLARQLQRQLKRVGCYGGAIDGKWGGGSVRALRNFNHWSGRDLPVSRPTSGALRAVSRTKGPVCGVD